MSNKTYIKPSDSELKKKLSRLEYEVTQNDATEPAFQNRFWDNHVAGLYVDIASGEPLFSSKDKFDSGTGWPSFARPVEGERVVEKRDNQYGMVRVEVRSKAGGSHLGHVFNDGPAPTGLRYCINSASLRFVPVAELESQGYGAYQSLFGVGSAPALVVDDTAKDNSCVKPPPSEKAGCNSSLETVVLAGGCFWGMEEILRAVPGVLETDVGYAGGTVPHPTYKQVSSGASGHAESVRITFDPAKISLAELLEKWFFRLHDPTTLNRQGNDTGSQYRSAIFVSSPEQRKVALDVKAKVFASGKWSKPIVTEITDAGEFTLAEDYHQNYLQEHPGGYTCHYLRD